MSDTKEQIFVDARTWFPVAYFTWVPRSEEPWEKDQYDLHQMWVSALGQTEWRPIEKRNLKEMTKAYAECQSFGPSEDPDL